MTVLTETARVCKYIYMHVILQMLDLFVTITYSDCEYSDFKKMEVLTVQTEMSGLCEYIHACDTTNV